jgi:hypothetical protein
MMDGGLSEEWEKAVPRHIAFSFFYFIINLPFAPFANLLKLYLIFKLLFNFIVFLLISVSFGVNQCFTDIQSDC